MNYIYLNMFDSLFFNVENREDVKSAIKGANCVLSKLVIKYGEIVNEIAAGTSGQGKFVDFVVCLFARKIMEQLDAINILYSSCSFSQAQIILRSLIENIVSLKFILKEDTEKRAAAYWLEHHLQEIEIGKDCFNNDDSEYKEQAIKHDGEEQYNIDKERFVKKREALQRIIGSKPIYRAVYEARKEKRKNLRCVQWYTVISEITNFKGMMAAVGYGKYYQAIYGGLSYETHALNSTMDIVVENDNMCIKQIRQPNGGESIFSLACSFSMGALTKIYSYLNDSEDEKKEFKDFFLEFAQERDEVCQKLNSI